VKKLGSPCLGESFLALEKDIRTSVVIAHCHSDFARVIVVRASHEIRRVVRLIGFGLRTNKRKQGIVEQMIRARQEFVLMAFSKVIFGVAAIMSHIHLHGLVMELFNWEGIFSGERYEPNLTNLCDKEHRYD
jgi:hypothetical protein